MQMIILPGMHGTDALLDPFLKLLPGKIEAKVIEYPKERVLTYLELEALVVSSLPLEGDYIIVAESFSGPIALRIADQSDSRLKGTALICSFAHRPVGRVGFWIAKLPLSLFFGMPIPGTILRLFLLRKSAPAGIVREVRRAIQGVSPSVLQARLREALASNYCCWRAESPAVVAIFGAQDRLLGKAARMSILEVCPDAQFETIAAPHLALQSSPAAVIAILRKYNMLSY